MAGKLVIREMNKAEIDASIAREKELYRVAGTEITSLLMAHRIRTVQAITLKAKCSLSVAAEIFDAHVNAAVKDFGLAE